MPTPLRDVLTGFELQGVTKWIIDLRDDPGGREDTNAMSLFVPDGVLVKSRFRDRTEEERATGATLPVVRPTVLLADNRTGSVAELFAAGLQEYGVAHVIGQTTNGCVGFTDVQPLGDGSSLAVTVAVNIGPVTGKELAGVGVVPDQAVARTQADVAERRRPPARCRGALLRRLKGPSGRTARLRPVIPSAAEEAFRCGHHRPRLDHPTPTRTLTTSVRRSSPGKTTRSCTGRPLGVAAGVRILHRRRRTAPRCVF